MTFWLSAALAASSDASLHARAMVALHGKPRKAGFAAAAVALPVHHRGQAPRALLRTLQLARPGRTELGASQGRTARRTDEVALLIDGDQSGPQWFESVLLAVQTMSGERPACPSNDFTIRLALCCSIR